MKITSVVNRIMGIPKRETLPSFNTLIDISSVANKDTYKQLAQIQPCLKNYAKANGVRSMNFIQLFPDSEYIYISMSKTPMQIIGAKINGDTRKITQTHISNEVIKNGTIEDNFISRVYRIVSDMVTGKENKDISITNL